MNKTLTPASIRAAAHAFRSQYGAQDQLALDFLDILKKLSRVRPKIQVKVVPPEDAPALAWTDARTLYVQKNLIDRLAHDDVHARYIIAHEIGHIVLNHHLVENRSLDQAEHYRGQRLEFEAGLFAAALLLPSSLVTQFQTAAEVSDRLQVSHHAAQGRFAELVSADALPVAPATRARTDVIDALIDRGYSESEISDLVVPKRTLARRRAENELLTVEETDKALRLSRIAKLANRVFGDPAKAYRWLRKPKRTLNGGTPVAFLASEEGARKVEEMLHRIDFGIAA